MKILIRYLILFSFCTFASLKPCVAQKTNPSQKGAIPLPQGGTTNNQHLSTNKTTRAVIVGISDYQSPEIPDLKFADKDAIAFAEWLQSSAGGNVASLNIQLLTNQNATQGKFAHALDWLKESSKEGDQAIIYFSGHGDIEVKLRTQPGYLLCSDAPPKVYTAGGTFRLTDLQDIISTISIDHKAQVLIITDACHSGKLAGSIVNGSQATAMALKQQFANETKILSCQPNEYSLEGTQWGGGRGAFSFHLLEGLTGLADKDKNQVVTLSEIDQYLEEKVVAETNPIQTPFTIGDKHSIVARVNANALLSLIKTKRINNEDIETIGFKATIDGYLETADTLIKQKYSDFELALEKGELLDSKKQSKSANDAFLQITQIDPSNPLYNLMRRNLAAALQDEVQQALNAILDDNPYEINNWRWNKNKYSKYPEYIDYAIKLIGTGHYLYKPLMAKKLFFEAYEMVHYTGVQFVYYSDSLKLAARNKLRQALSFDETAFIYYQLANTFMYENSVNFNHVNDSIDTYYQKAMALAPNWKLPYAEISWYYLDVAGQLGKAEQWLKMGLSIGPDSYNLVEMYAWLFGRYEKLDMDSVEAICKRMRKLHPDLYSDYVTLALGYSAKRNYKLAEFYANKISPLDTLYASPIHNLIQYIYCNTRRLNKVDQTILHWILLETGLIWFNKYNIADLEKMDSILKHSFVSEKNYGGNVDLMYNRGFLNTMMQRYDTAEFMLRTALHMDTVLWPIHIRPLAYLGLICNRTGRIKDAEDYFIKAINDHPEIYTPNKLSYMEGYYLYGNFLAEQNRYQEAEEKYQYINKKDYGCVLGFYGMATLRARQGKDKEALDWLEKALDWYFPRPEPIYDEPVFKTIRKTKRFKDMMEKNFPSGF